jgi:hypothetical protein
LPENIFVRMALEVFTKHSGFVNFIDERQGGDHLGLEHRVDPRVLVGIVDDAVRAEVVRPRVVGREQVLEVPGVARVGHAPRVHLAIAVGVIVGERLAHRVELVNGLGLRDPELVGPVLAVDPGVRAADSPSGGDVPGLAVVELPGVPDVIGQLVPDRVVFQEVVERKNRALIAVFQGLARKEGQHHPRETSGGDREVQVVHVRVAGERVDDQVDIELLAELRHEVFFQIGIIRHIVEVEHVRVLDGRNRRPE